ncbi:MAG: HAMP domain-containing histidine kinase, partial [Rheinheimera sp.]
MKPLLRTTSIKSALSWVVMLICSITLFASLTISSLQDISFQKKELVDQLHAYANIVAFNSKASILYDDAEMEDGRLKSFEAVEILHNIHIYKLTAETNQLSFFSSYNSREVGPHPTQFEKVNDLLEPHFDGDIIELTKA